MGSNCQTIMTVRQQDKQKSKIPTIISKPGSKTTLQYINPVVIDDDDNFQNGDFEQCSEMMTNESVTEKEYQQIEQNEENEASEVHEIKVKWNNFIKMKKSNYLNDYQIIKQIGRGGFGKVNKVKSKYTGLFRAAKRIRKASLGKQQHQKLFTEMAIMQSLDHVNITKLFQVYDYKSHYVLILQLCEGGELFKKIIIRQNFAEQYIARVIKQILKTLLYLNHKGIIHRDIKPQNLLFQKDTELLKIIDFGIAVQRTNKQNLTERVGTPYYIAPQVLLKSYDEKCDIWSTGVIMYMMMSHRPPFRGESEVQVMRNILSTQAVITPQIKKNFSKECISFLQSLLLKNPHQRIDVQTAYNHPWLHQASTAPIDNKGEQEVIEQIQNFKFKNRLQAVVYTFLVSQLMTSEQKATFIQIFQDLDKNHDGVISKLQFQQALKLKTKIPESRVAILMRVIDTNSSGYIDMTEFIVAGLKSKTFFTKEHFEQAFTYFDIDHSGVISYEEIAFFLQDKSKSVESIKQIFREVDENNDGVISRDEFVNLLMRTNKLKYEECKRSTTC